MPYDKERKKSKRKKVKLAWKYIQTETAGSGERTGFSPMYRRSFHYFRPNSISYRMGSSTRVHARKILKNQCVGPDRFRPGVASC